MTEDRQLSLWDDEVAKEEVPPQQQQPVPAIGETMEWPCRGWADGDTSPAALQHLAEVLLQPGLGLEVWPLNNGQNIWFRTVAARVEGAHIMQTLRRIEPLIHGCHDRQTQDEEEEAA